MESITSRGSGPSLVIAEMGLIAVPRGHLLEESYEALSSFTKPLESTCSISCNVNPGFSLALVQVEPQSLRSLSASPPSVVVLDLKAHMKNLYSWRLV